MASGTEHFHFMGIAGAGMSALAEVLAGRGEAVDGCDTQPASAARLEACGIRVVQGHDPSHVEGVTTLAFSSAIAEGHPEIAAARAHGVRLVRRGQLLAELLNPSWGIAVAGSHGKTTTAAMVACALIAAGQDPTALVGGMVPEFGGHARLGRKDFVVAEADESDGSFMWLCPHVAVVTNVDDDHVDHYGSMAALEEAFRQFVVAVPPSGAVVLCADDPRAAALAVGTARTVTYGLLPGAEVRAEEVDVQSIGARFRARVGDAAVDVELCVPGVHNVVNALAALAVGRTLGLAPEVLLPGIAAFRGVGRRLEFKGEREGVRVFDDYGHHPTEVRASLAALRPVVGGRLIVLFQPHRYSRTARLAAAFGPALAEVDELVVTDVYAAAETPIPGVSGLLVAEAARRSSGRQVAYTPTLDEALARLREIVEPGDVVLTLGAGDIYRVGERFLTESASWQGEADGPGTRRRSFS